MDEYERKKQKAECIRLRTIERLSYKEISEKTGVAKSTLSSWLKPYPLTEAELKERAKKANRYKTPKKDRGEPSKFYKSTCWDKLDTRQKGIISETAVLFRLYIRGFFVYRPIAEGERVDCIAETPDFRKRWKIQIKTVKVQASGLPIVPLVRSGYNRYVCSKRYKEGEFDFIVGYDLFSDTAYVFSWDEVKAHKRSVTITPESAERWDKLLDYNQ